MVMLSASRLRLVVVREFDNLPSSEGWLHFRNRDTNRDNDKREGQPVRTSLLVRDRFIGLVRRRGLEPYGLRR